MKGVSFKKELGIQAGIFLLALMLRLIYLYQSTSGPTFTTPVVDAGVYDITARMMAAGKGVNYYHNFFWQPPFYPAFLALVYAISNNSILLAKLVQAILGSFCCLLTYRLGRNIFKPAVGIISGIMVAAYGPLIFFEQELLACGWAVFWSLALMLLFLDAADRGKWWVCMVLGVCGALSILTRPVFLPFFMAGTIWLIIRFFQRENPVNHPILKLFLILAGFCLIALPVAEKNKKITGHYGIVSAGGGINLYIGNNPDATGTLTARPGRDWRKITNLAGQNGGSGDMWTRQEYYFKRFKDFVRSQPVLFMRGLAGKTVRLFNSREIPRNVDIYLFRQWSWLLGQLTWKVNGFGFPFGVLLPLTLAGLILCWQRIPVLLKIYLFLNPLLLILIFVTARYRIPLIPVMSVVATAGLLRLKELIGASNPRLFWITGTVMAVVVLVSTLPGPFPEEEINYEAELYADTGEEALRRGRTDQAIVHLDYALALKFNFPSAHGNLGMALTRKGRYQEAIKHFNIALEQDDSAAEVHNNLASALAGINETDRALEHYSRAIALNPRYPEAHYNLGNILFSRGKLEDAINHLNAAVQIDDDFFEAYNSLAVALAERGDIEQATNRFHEAIRLRPYEQQPRFNLAVALADSGRKEEAISELRQLLEYHPRLPRVLDYLARLLITARDQNPRYATEAIISAAKACRLTDYQQPLYIGTLADAYAAAGDFPRATALARKGLRITTDAGQDTATDYFQSRLKHYRSKMTGKQKD